MKSLYIYDIDLEMYIFGVILKKCSLCVLSAVTSPVSIIHKLKFCPFFTSSNSLSLMSISEKYNFLGISIVGQSNDRGDGGIYIGSIMKGGAVAADGRIEPGDMLLQVSTHIISNNIFGQKLFPETGE